jgi:ABC-type glutathione transport system ATPase component
MPDAAPPLLEVRDLTVSYLTDEGPPVTAVDRPSLDVRTGEVLGVLGESGCGKSSLASSRSRASRSIRPAGPESRSSR